MTTKEEIQNFFAREFPGSKLEIESIGNRKARVKVPVTTKDLRPGGTVSGPFMMTLADATLYTTILGELGPVAMAVTTNLNINFLNKPSADRNVIGECHLLKVGSKLVIGEVYLYSEGEAEPIAHAVGTYSLPVVK